MTAIKEKIARLNKSRLARACELLDPNEEQAFAEIGVSADLEELESFQTFGELDLLVNGRPPLSAD